MMFVIQVLMYLFTTVLGVIEPGSHTVYLQFGLDATARCPPVLLEKGGCVQMCTHHDLCVNVDSWVRCTVGEPCKR